MTEVGITIGRTINLGNYENAKVEVSIGGIDVNGDIDFQLEQCHAAINKIWPKVKKASAAQADIVRKGG